MTLRSRSRIVDQPRTRTQRDNRGGQHNQSSEHDRRRWRPSYLTELQYHRQRRQDRRGPDDRGDESPP